jgi:hypothetical protein
MGCWNKTCGLSNLHIMAGMPVYVFVLEKTEHYDNCYTTSLFKPLLLPFESTYNDYGGGENSHGVALDLIVGGIKEQLVELDAGENVYHDIAVKREGFDVDQFFEAVHENRLTIKGWTNKEVPVYFTMFRKDIVDSILEDHVIEDYVGEGRGTCGWNNNYIRYKFADIVADIRPLINAAVKELDDLNAVDKELRAFKLTGFQYMDVSDLDNKVIRWMRGIDYRYSRIVDMRVVIAEHLSTGTAEALDRLETLLVEHLKAIFIEGFMSAARKTWIPGGHEGSQSYSGDALRVLNRAVESALVREDAEMTEDEESQEVGVE